MALLSFWADSIAFLWTDNGKLALYGLYKAMKETYWVLIAKFWWFILFFVVMGRFALLLPELRYFFALIWTVVTILIVRPSMSKKDYSYFAHYLYFVIAAVLLGLLFSIFKSFLRPFLLGLFSLSKGIYSPIYLSIAFFMSESNNLFSSVVKNIMQGLKMILYNYPLFLIIHSLLFIGWKFIFVPCLVYASKPLTIIFGPLYFYYVRIFLLPIYVCIVNTLYIQRRAAQPDLYEVL